MLPMAVENGLEALLALPERDHVERHVAEREPAAPVVGDDERVAAVEHAPVPTSDRP